MAATGTTSQAGHRESAVRFEQACSELARSLDRFAQLALEIRQSFRGMNDTLARRSV